MKTLKSFFLLLALSLIGQSVAAGRNPQQSAPGGFRVRTFAEMDKNKDGKITKDEWIGPPQVFDRVDENHDGSIDQNEWNRAAAQMLGSGDRFPILLMRFLDAGKDGYVSRDEFSRLAALFDILDKDHDGRLSQTELNGFLASVSEAQEQATGGVDVDKLFEKYDKNKDGKISKEEMNNDRVFVGLDLDKDGVITRDEAARAVREMAKKNAKPGGSN